MKEDKYPLIGKWVEVKAFMKPRKRFGKRDHTLCVLKDTRYGLVTGYRTVFDGETHFGKKDYWGECNPPFFVPTNPIKVLLVVFWPTLNPVLVKLNDVREILTVHGCTTNAEDLKIFFPEKYHPNTTEWLKESRETLRKIMKDMPRDEKGRWKR